MFRLATDCDLCPMSSFRSCCVTNNLKFRSVHVCVIIPVRVCIVIIYLLKLPTGYINVVYLKLQCMNLVECMLMCKVLQSPKTPILISKFVWCVVLVLIWFVLLISTSIQQSMYVCTCVHILCTVYTSTRLAVYIEWRCVSVLIY